MAGGCSSHVMDDNPRVTWFNYQNHGDKNNTQRWEYDVDMMGIWWDYGVEQSKNNDESWLKYQLLDLSQQMEKVDSHIA